MNYKQEREQRGWTTQQVSEQIGKSVAAINGIEKHGKGGFELRFLLDKLYGAPDPAAELKEPSPTYQVKPYKIALAKIRHQVQNIQAQIDAINETLNELDKS